MNVLEGLRVVDLSLNIAGPYCTQILGDLGADVIKVEPPGGDPARQWGPPFWGGDTPLFLSSNRNKRSIVVNLKSEDGKAVVERMLDGADIFVQAFRKGVIESLGFGCERLQDRDPALIYVSVTGFGSEGPLAETPGYDPLMQAYSGMMSITGHPDGPPARCGASVIDLGTGMVTALGIVAAIRERDKSGRGTHVEASLLDTSLSLVSYHLYAYLASGETPQRWGSGLGMITPYEAFPTNDGELMISGANDAIFARLCEALGLEETAKDVRFRDNATRIAHKQELLDVLTARTREFSTVELRVLLERHRVPCSPIQSIDQVVDDPQVRATKMLEPYPHPRIPDYRDLGFPLKLDGDRPGARTVPPKSGEHSHQVLAELGYSKEEIEELISTGSVAAED